MKKSVWRHVALWCSAAHQFFMMGQSLFFSLFNLNFTILQLVDKICLCWDSNHGSLVLDATTLPTEPQPLPVVGRISLQASDGFEYP